MGGQGEANLVLAMGEKPAGLFSPLHGQEIYRVSGLAYPPDQTPGIESRLTTGQLVGRGQGVRPVADGASHRMRPPTDPPSGGGPLPGYCPDTVQLGANRHEILLTEVSFRTLTASGAFVCLEKGRVDPFSRGCTRDRRVERREGAPGSWAFCQSEPPRELPRTLPHPPTPGLRHRQNR